ncbi:MAG: hypothetical protein U9O94_08980 [Nanoarchaeota archaeon]|nr:hypothetical protein [Nanoarchaeota archaeon]
MEDKETNVKYLQKQQEQEIIEVGTKTIFKKFMVSMPNNSVDFDILTEVLSPDFISEEMKKEGNKEYVGAIAYLLNEHDKIRSIFSSKKSKRSITDKKNYSFMLDYLDKTKLKIVEPNSEFLRIGDRTNTSFDILSKVPPYLLRHLKARKIIKGLNRKQIERRDDSLYYAFWFNLFYQDEKTRKRDIVGFISWTHEKEIEERNADFFLPSVPYIKRGFNVTEKLKFLQYLDETNKLSYHLYGDTSAFYCVIDADLFKDTNSINQICNIISKCKNKFIVIKIINVGKFSQPNFGYYSTKNLLHFLRVIQDTKVVRQDRVTGLLNGGGFGYCLFSTVFDFYTDTVNNYPTEGRATYTGKHRGLLHPITLAVEPSEGVGEQLKQHGALFLDNSIADKYLEVSSLDNIDKSIWSKDCRRMGLVMWQKRIFAKLMTDKHHVFDEVYNSSFAFLGNIVKTLANS